MWRCLTPVVALSVLLSACAQDNIPTTGEADSDRRVERSLDPFGKAAAEPRPTPTPAAEVMFDVADAVVPSVALYDSPASTPAVETLAHPAPFGVPLTFMVLDRQGDRLHVQVPTRPNQRTAWIRAADVAVRKVPNRVLVELGSRRVSVFRGHSEEMVFQAPVAIGEPATPTPIGDLYYVDALVALSNPGGVFGPYQLRISAFSEVLFSFDGGPGQVAFHGTNAPHLIGEAVSNGCIRMANADITRLAELADVGTPVRIVP
ncbi:MAG: L,D-transpeptidase [Acidimicrobiales bacterium]